MHSFFLFVNTFLVSFLFFYSLIMLHAVAQWPDEVYDYTSEDAGMLHLFQPVLSIDLTEPAQMMSILCARIGDDHVHGQ